MQNRKKLIKHWTRGILLAGVFLINATLNADALDTITLSNGECGENGAIVDGYVGTTFHNDYLPPVKPSEQAIQLAIGNLVDNGPLPSEVIAFTNNRPPTLKTPPPEVWTTNSNDNVSFSFEDKYKIPVTVWIVSGSYTSQSERAEVFRVVTNNIWQNERQGFELDLAQFKVENARNNSSAADFALFNCNKANEFTVMGEPNSGDNRIQLLIGSSPNQINIYFVNAVSETTSAGPSGSALATTHAVYCHDVIAIGSFAMTHLLAHELGHAFALTHVGALSGFTQSNVMHEASSDRRYLTEGQTFRAVVDSFSKINTNPWYNKRPGLVIRQNCGPQTNNNLCPLLQTRLWPDTNYTYASCPSDITPPMPPTNLRTQ